MAEVMVTEVVVRIVVEALEVVTVTVDRQVILTVTEDPAPTTMKAVTVHLVKVDPATIIHHVDTTVMPRQANSKTTEAVMAAAVAMEIVTPTQTQELNQVVL